MIKAFQVAACDQPPELVQIAPPEPGPGEVRLRILACGLNFADLLMAQGRYQDMPPLPFTLGMEVAGVVTDLGPGVSAPSVGTRVAVFGGHGGLAEAGVFPADRCLPLPDGMTDTVAAAFQIGHGTAHLALTRRARLRAGETLLVTGAAGGTGLAAVEIGHALGARVIAMVRDAEKAAVAQAAGADHVLTARDDAVAAVREMGGADVVYDTVGDTQQGAGFAGLIRATRPEGRILSIGFAAGGVPRITANHLLVKNIDVIGFYWGGYLRFAPAVLDAGLAEVMGWIAQGRLRPHVGDVLPLDRAAEGMELIRSRRATGKVVIRP